MHALLNGVLYAYDLQIFNVVANFDLWSILVFSIIVIAIPNIISKTELKKDIDDYSLCGKWRKSIVAR